LLARACLLGKARAFGIRNRLELLLARKVPRISLRELEVFSCDHLAVQTGGLQGSDSIAALFNAFDEFGIGELPQTSFNVFGGEVAFSGYKRLVQSMFPSSWDAFLIYDTNFDRRLQREELKGARERSKGAPPEEQEGRGESAERDRASTACPPHPVFV